MKNDQSYLTERVKGKRIAITGGTTGIGCATALLLAKEGANVIITGRHEQEMNDALKDIKATARGDVYGVINDLADESGVTSFFTEADNQLGGLDILINNAALGFGSVTDGGYGDIEYIVKTNLMAYLACSREAIKRMKGNGGGHIVNIGSMSADVREVNSAVYVATKSGIQGFSESLRKEVNPDGIKVTLIEPGAVDTDMQEEDPETKKQNVKDLEMLTADDIAAGVLYCLSQPKRCDVVELKIRPHLQLI